MGPNQNQIPKVAKTGPNHTGPSGPRIWPGTAWADCSAGPARPDAVNGPRRARPGPFTNTRGRGSKVNHHRPSPLVVIFIPFFFFLLPSSRPFALANQRTLQAPPSAPSLEPCLPRRSTTRRRWRVESESDLLRPLTQSFFHLLDFPFCVFLGKNLPSENGNLTAPLIVSAKCREEKPEEPELPKYRDRAKERREDQNPDYEPTELGSFHAVAPPGNVDLRLMSSLFRVSKFDGRFVFGC